MDLGVKLFTIAIAIHGDVQLGGLMGGGGLSVPKKNCVSNIYLTYCCDVVASTGTSK